MTPIARLIDAKRHHHYGRDSSAARRGRRASPLAAGNMCSEWRPNRAGVHSNRGLHATEEGFLLRDPSRAYEPISGVKMVE